MVKAGDELDGRYRLISEIGSGAYGVVYRSRDLETRAEVAIKVMKQTPDPELARRYEREAQALARLRGRPPSSSTPSGAPPPALRTS